MDSSIRGHGAMAASSGGAPPPMDGASQGTNGGGPPQSINEIMLTDISGLGVGLDGLDRDIGVQSINVENMQQYQTCFDQINNDENGGDTENLRGGGNHNNGFAYVGESPSFYTPNPNNRGGGGNVAPHSGVQAFNSTQQYVPNQYKYQEFYSFTENQLIESIKASLNHELYSNAAFLCERLFAHVQNEDVKHLLAQCYLGDGKAYKAYEVLKDCESAKNRYKFALTCIKLSRYPEAELALTGAKLPQNQNKGPSYILGNHHLDLNTNRSIPHGAPGYYLLGFVLESQFKNEKAVECYERALQLQPTLWCAFERLCRLQGGPGASNDRVDAAKIFTEHNADILQMNSLIREHMTIRLASQGNAGGNPGQAAGVNVHASGQAPDLGPFNRNGISVNNFDQSPMPNSNQNALDQKFLDDAGCSNSQVKQKNGNLKFLQTNQKTPAASKPVYNRDMKENMASEGLSAGLGSSSMQSAAGRVAGAPQKHLGLVDQTSSGAKADEIHDNKFDEEPIIHNGGTSQSQLEYDLEKNLKTPTPSGQHQITPTSHVYNERHLRKSIQHVQNAPSQNVHPSRLVYLNNYASNGAGGNPGTANGGLPGSQQMVFGGTTLPSQLQFDSSSKDGANAIHATEAKNPALYNQGSGDCLGYGANVHLAGSAAPSSSQLLVAGSQPRRGTAGPHGANQHQQHYAPTQTANGAGGSMVSCYTSFFNQTNIIGDPVVKPFTIGTPIQQQQNNIQPSFKAQNINQHFVAGGGKQTGFAGCMGSEVKGTAANIDRMVQGLANGVGGSQSASKQIGAHLVQMQQTAAKQQQNRADNQGAGQQWDLISLLRHLGQAYQMQSDYRCQEAIQMYKKLPKAHLQTAWVSAQIARCHFELSQYTDAAKMYETMLKQQSYRLEGLEYYSTCLWHLRKQMDLCYIANYALERSLYAPETWCVLGNCYALQKEHETALKFFGRAIQLNPFFAYAHSLSGHEYVEIEDFEQAKKCYREALKAEERHYTAWWGLGNIFQKQEKYETAAYNFNQALAINGRSAVLHTYLGMTLHNQNLLAEACACFDKASELDPSNILNKYQKSQVLLTMDKEQEALELLLDLKQELPKEAPVFIGIGKIYKKLGQVQPALENFSAALDLDPKDINQVNNMMKTIEQQNDMSDEQNDAEF